MCLHIILAQILREIDASQYTPYKRRSRWKAKWKRKSTMELEKSLTSRGSNYTKCSNTYQTTKHDIRIIIGGGHAPITVKEKSEIKKDR
jgi:hypothetical protein